MHRLQSALLMVAAVAAVAAAQPRTVVFDFEAVAVDTQTVPVLGTLLRDRLSDTRAFTVVAPPPGTRFYSIDKADSFAKTVNAEKAVLGSITKTGQKLLISYRLVDVNSGVIEFSDRTSISTEDEFDAVTQRMATSLKNKEPYTATMEMGKVTESEANAAKSRQPFSSVVFTTGYTFPLYHRMTPDPGTMWFTLDAAITYEAPSFLAQGIMGLETGKNTFRDVHFELLGHRMLSNKDVSPYVGGGFGVHRLWLDGHTSDGLSVAGSGGVVLFRTYYFRVISGVKATALFTQDNGPIVTGAINFGLTSPGVGPGGSMQTPPACIYGVLGTFFVTGLLIFA